MENDALMIYDDLPLKHDDFPARYVKLPEGTEFLHIHPTQSWELLAGQTTRCSAGLFFLRWTVGIICLVSTCATYSNPPKKTKKNVESSSRKMINTTKVYLFFLGYFCPCLGRRTSLRWRGASTMDFIDFPAINLHFWGFPHDFPPWFPKISHDFSRFPLISPDFPRIFPWFSLGSSHVWLDFSQPRPRFGVRHPPRPVSIRAAHWCCAAPERRRAMANYASNWEGRDVLWSQATLRTCWP